MVLMPPTGSVEELWLYQDTVGRGELVWGRPGNHRYKVIGRYVDGVFTPWLSN